MSRTVCLAMVPARIAGCVRPLVIPDRHAVPSIKHAYVAPMESRPLGVPPGFDSVIAGYGGSSQSARSGQSVRAERGES
jgi:hypothetical protein